MVTVSSEGDESSCVLEKMEVVVFKSYLQRSKSVIFEGLVIKVWLWCLEDWKRRRWTRRRKSGEKLEDLRVRERKRSCKNEMDECVWGVMAIAYTRPTGSYFVSFCVN